MRRLPGLLVAAMLCGPALAVPEQDSAKQWLEKMTSAEQYLNYEGTFIYINGPKVETMQIIHGFDEKGERERITLLTGSSREIVRDEKHVFSVLPRKKQVIIEPRRPASEASAFLDTINGDNTYYDFELNGNEHIANHVCRIVSIFPKDQYRYGYRLCIDNDTGLLLKSQTLDNSGQPREQMIFTNLELPDAIPTRHLQTTLHEKDFELLESKPLQAAASVVENAWGFSELLPGFRIIHNEMRQLASAAQPVQHIVLNDGLATISVFIAPYEQDEPYSEGVASSGALNAISQLKNGHILTIIGDVPKKTVQLLAAALTPPEATATHSPP